MDQFGNLGSFQALLKPQKRPKNQNEANVFTCLLEISLRQAEKPNRMSSITLGNQADLPEIADKLTNLGFYVSQISQIFSISM